MVINNPKYDIPKKEIDIISSYLDDGMSLVVLSEALRPVGAINELLKNFGLEFQDNYLFLHPKDPRVKLLGQDVAVVDDLGSHEISQIIKAQSMPTILMPQSRSIKPSIRNKRMFRSSAIALSKNASLAINRVRDLDDFKKKDTSDLEAGEYILAAISQGYLSKLAGKEPIDLLNQKVGIALFGSSNFVNNIGVQRGENLDLFLNTINYLSQDRTLMGIKSKHRNDYYLNNSSVRSSVVLIILSYVFPFVCPLFLFLRWYRRRAV